MRAAAFHSVCEECEGEINVGDMIEERSGAWVHAECPEPEGFAVRPGETICPDCFMIHAGECP